jgi:hypothetical protein
MQLEENKSDLKIYYDTPFELRLNLYATRYGQLRIHTQIYDIILFMSEEKSSMLIIKYKCTLFSKTKQHRF